MRLAPIASLVVEDRRQRQLFEDKPLEQLMTSIATRGLMHPPVCRLTDHGVLVLVAGERRFRAISALANAKTPIRCDGAEVPLGQIPYILIADLNPLTAKEAELEENIIREPLTWQERANAIAELHELRKSQAAAEGRTQSARATVAEIRGGSATVESVNSSLVTEAIIIAKHLDDPDVAKAKTTSDALKIIQKKAEVAHRAKLAAEFDKTKSPHSLVLGDSFELLTRVPDASFDMVCTDPPYGVGADSFGDMASTGHAYKDTEEYARQCFLTLARESARILKPRASVVCFLDINFFEYARGIFSAAGFEVWPRPLIWYKANGMLPKPDFGPRNTYEAILFATRGQPRYIKTGAHDVIPCASRSDISHGAQKPVELYTELISRSALPGSAILDPFAGSGTIFPAASKAHCVATGFEIHEEYYNLALSRMGVNDIMDDPELGL